MFANGSRAPEWLAHVPVAHRGLHGGESAADTGAPVENGLASIEAARIAGFATEIDVFLSRDGVPMVIHDEDLTRATGVAAKVGDLDASEIAALTLFGSDERVPTLAQAFDAARSDSPLLIEIKPGKRLNVLASAVCDAIEGSRNEAAIMSFHPLVLDWLRRNRPRVPRGMLGGTPQAPDLNLGLIQRAMVTAMPLAALAMPDFMAIEQRHLGSVFTTSWRTVFRGPVLAYTILSPEERESALRKSDNIIFEGFVP